MAPKPKWLLGPFLWSKATNRKRRNHHGKASSRKQGCTRQEGWTEARTSQGPRQEVHDKGITETTEENQSGHVNAINARSTAGSRGTASGWSSILALRDNANAGRVAIWRTIPRSS